MININNYDFIIFDCDGVILDSNKLKSRAFAEALPNEPPELVAEFVEYHKKNGGISRYEKFRYYFEKVKKTGYSKEDKTIALNRFASIVKNGLLECDYVLGVLEFLKNVKDKKLLLFVVSGSDENELKDVFSQRGILHYFKRIYGSPANKNENTERVKKVVGSKKKGLFFGDSKSDLIAAKEYELYFVFVKEASEWKDGDQKNKKEGNLIIKNFTDITLNNTSKSGDFLIRPVVK